jgi:hypothetical protein
MYTTTKYYTKFQEKLQTQKETKRCAEGEPIASDPALLSELTIAGKLCCTSHVLSTTLTLVRGFTLQKSGLG